MNEDNYLTIENASQGLFKEKGSKFLSFAYPVESEDQVKQILEKLRKEYYDARHICYAYMLGSDQSHYRANDDGEPNHSAGDPILGQIRSKGLTNVLVVVVRYFGGTKLGVPGLINAYKTAAADALDSAKVVEKVVRESLTIHFEYPSMNDVMRLIKEHDIEINQQEFGIQCNMNLKIRKSQLIEVKEKLILQKVTFNA